MSGPEDRELPLFPLGLVLLPGEILPLHIFEERYKRLIGWCRETGDPMGIVLQTEDGLAPVGCEARVVAVIEEFADGRLNIVVRGEGRFAVAELLPPDEPEAEPLRARVEALEDLPSVPPADVSAEVENLFSRALELTGVEPSPLSPQDIPPSYVVSIALGMETALKQRLLQLREEDVRLVLVAGFLRLLVPRLERWKEREDAIRGNGKGH